MSAKGGRRCASCFHEYRRDIDRALVRGDSLASISRKYSLHPDALARHRDGHLTPAIRAAAERAEAEAKAAEDDAAADDLLTDLSLAKKILRAVMSRALAANKLDSVTKACSAFIAALERQAKLEGRITEASTTVVMLDPSALTAKIDAQLARLAPPVRTIQHQTDE